MTINDDIYGSFEVDQMLEELMGSLPVRRLKNIHQGGAIFLVNPAINHSRYDHSVGTLFLVKYLGGSMEEQVAALLHDVSHTAFSHVADYVFGYADEDYHETIFRDVVSQSPITSILEKYGMNCNILFKNDYHILEQPLPGLCADRIDYTLRDSYMAGFITLTQIRNFLKELMILDGKVVVRSETVAQWIKKLYQKLNTDYFRKPEYMYANLQLAEVLKVALNDGVIQMADLLTDDFRVLQKLTAHSCYQKLVDDIKRLTNFKNFHISGASDRLKRRELHPAIMV